MKRKIVSLIMAAAVLFNLTTLSFAELPIGEPEETTQPVSASEPVEPEVWEIAPVDPGEGEQAPETPVDPGEGEQAPETPVDPGEGEQDPEIPVAPGEGEQAPEIPVAPGEGEQNALEVSNKVSAPFAIPLDRSADVKIKKFTIKGIVELVWDEATQAYIQTSIEDPKQYNTYDVEIDFDLLNLGEIDGNPGNYYIKIPISGVSCVDVAGGTVISGGEKLGDWNMTENVITFDINYHIIADIGYTEFTDGYFAFKGRFDAAGPGEFSFLDPEYKGNVNVTASSWGVGYIEPGKGVLRVVKTDDTVEKNPIADVKFNLHMGTDPCWVREIEVGKYLFVQKGTPKDSTGLTNKLTTDGDGKIVVDKLTPRTDYTLTEDPKEGYRPNTTVYSLVIVKETLVEQSVENTPIASVTLNKVDNFTNVPLAGAEFELYRVVTGEADEKIGGTYTTVADGTIVIDDQELGEYYFIETKVPDGYKKSTVPADGKYFFTLNTPGQADTVIRVENVPIATVQFTKVVAGTATPLEGAVFKLEKETPINSGTWVNTNKTYTSSATGLVQATGLEMGSYRFIETTAPAGYGLDTTPIEFELTVPTTLGNPNVLANFGNSQNIGSVKLTKIDAVSNNLLSGAVFTLYDSNHVKLGEHTTVNGEIVVSKLQFGDYYFIETSAPNGYMAPKDTKYPFTINKTGATVSVGPIANIPVGSLTINKVDELDPTRLLQGAEFELYKIVAGVDQKIGDTYTTDVEGRINIPGLELGSYYFKETKAPDGYKISEVKYDFVISQAGQDEVTLVTNIPVGSLTINKVDELDPTRLLQGAEFELYKIVAGVDQKIGDTYTTDVEGTINIPDLELGNYYFKETKAPDGYKISEVKYDFVISQAGQDEVKLITNIPYGTAIITKIDTLNPTRKLEGAEFNLYKKNDVTGVFEIINENDFPVVYKSDKDGIMRVDLDLGEYHFIEIKAPAGYQLDKTPFDFIISDPNQKFVDIIKNTPIPTPGRPDRKDPPEEPHRTLYPPVRKIVNAGKENPDTGTGGTSLLGAFVLTLAMGGVGAVVQKKLRNPRSK